MKLSNQIRSLGGATQSNSGWIVLGGALLIAIWAASSSKVSASKQKKNVEDSKLEQTEVIADGDIVGDEFPFIEDPSGLTDEDDFTEEPEPLSEADLKNIEKAAEFEAFIEAGGTPEEWDAIERGDNPFSNGEDGSENPPFTDFTEYLQDVGMTEAEHRAFIKSFEDGRSPGVIDPRGTTQEVNIVDDLTQQSSPRITKAQQAAINGRARAKALTLLRTKPQQQASFNQEINRIARSSGSRSSPSLGVANRGPTQEQLRKEIDRRNPNRYVPNPKAKGNVKEAGDFLRRLTEKKYRSGKSKGSSSNSSSSKKKPATTSSPKPKTKPRPKPRKASKPEIKAATQASNYRASSGGYM
jgi:hypothetical protein